jgi:antitoxin component YwqK of YwqJK toxin-antitoxin module
VKGEYEGDVMYFDQSGKVIKVERYKNGELKGK